MKLHIANLSPKVTEDNLKKLFGEFGKIHNLELSWVQSVGRTSGTAIIEMDTAEALAAARNLSGQAFRNRRLYITLLGGTSVQTSPERLMAANRERKIS